MKVLCDYSNDSSDVGTLAIETEKQDYFVDNISFLIDFAKINHLEIVSRFEHLTQEEVKNKAEELISSVLKTIAESAAIEVHENIIDNCLSLLKDIKYKNGFALLSVPAHKQLVFLLIKDTYPEHRDAICNLIADRGYKLTAEQNLELNKLFIASNSSSILKLLSSKGSFECGVLAKIIDSIKLCESNKTDNSLYKDQLSVVVSSFNGKPKLDEELSAELIQFFKTSKDIELLSGMVKAIGNKSFFDPIITSLTTNLQKLTTILAVENEIAQLKKEYSAGLTYNVVKAKFNHIVERSDALLLSRSATFISTKFSISCYHISHKIWSDQYCADNLVSVQALLAKIIRTRVTLDKEFISCYEKYVLELLPSYVFQKSYPALLKVHTEFCHILQYEKYSLSKEYFELLITNSLKNPINDLTQTQQISIIICNITYDNSLAPTCTEAVISLLSKNAKLQDQTITISTMGAFEHLIKYNIQTDRVSDIICENYLNKAFTAEQVINALEYTTFHSHRLSKFIINSLTEFASDKNQLENLRIRAIALLQGASSYLPEESIPSLLPLLKGEVKTIYKGSEVLETRIQWQLPESINPNLLSLEYLQLDKYARANNFVLKNVPGDGNCFFHAISDQLTITDLGLSAAEIRLLAINELRSNKNYYQDFIEDCYSDEDYDRFINANMANGAWADDVMIQATSNALKIDINIYRFDHTISSKNCLDNPNGIKVNIGYTGSHYLPLLRDIQIEPSFHDISILDEKEGARTTTDYKIAFSVSKLLLRYLGSGGKVSQTIIDSLEQASLIEPLKPQAIPALALIAASNPILLKPELLDYIKAQDLETNNQIIFSKTLTTIEELINKNIDSSSLQTIKTELSNLTGLLNNVYYVGKLNKLYELLSVTITSPELFAESLSILKLATLHQKNIQIIEELISHPQIKPIDLCWFVNKGCRLQKLNNFIEEYFNGNIDSFKTNKDYIGELLFSLESIAGQGYSFADITINNLIKLAKILPSQAANLIKILNVSNATINSTKFSELEELFLIGDKQLTYLLANLFAKFNKQLASNEAISAIFGQKLHKKASYILPTEELKEEAKALLDLKSSIDDTDKNNILASIDSKVLQKETISTILRLLKFKHLSSACIKVLSNLTSIPYLDQEASEIIAKYQDILKDEYIRLEPLLAGSKDIALLTKEQFALKAIIENKFPMLHVSQACTAEIERNIDASKYGRAFVDQILLGQILDKASSTEEFIRFLVLINKNNISEEETACLLSQDSLGKIIDILDINLLSSALTKLKSHQEESGSDGELITRFCYQLKLSGWTIEGLTGVLQNISANNISLFEDIFRTIYEYQIKEEYRNKKGESVSDILGKYSDKELELEIYSIASNQFECKLENKGEELLKKLVELNPHFQSKAQEYLNALEKIHEIYYAGGDDAVGNWSAERIKEWATNFRSYYTVSNNINEASKDQGELQKPQDDMLKVITVLQKANNLHTAKQGKEGHLLRDTQILSLLALLDTDSGSKGRLLQVSTGEGKSTISSMLAAILALHGDKVDLITSSSVLAKTGYESSKGFFELLGLTSGINTDKIISRNARACYGCDIVYGDSLNFQSDLLSNTSNQGPRRGDREFAVTIVDEVDSMLVDSSNQFAKQNLPTPLMDYLIPVMTIAWHNFQNIILPMDLERGQAVEVTKEMIDQLIDKLPLPKHLENYAKFQSPKWANNLVGAATNWQLDRDYVINIDVEGKKTINPVDNSTGVTQENMVWQDGLHQFLQIKHNCRVSAEGLTSFFITNISYFRTYQKILGMTGTLGSESSQEFLKTIYGVDLTFLPTYKDKQIVELPGRIEETTEKWKEAICNNSIKEAISHNRAVLIICKTIKDAEDLYAILKSKCGNNAKIINYSRSEAKLYNSEIEEVTKPRTIIVATNLAGRGTDIKTSREVEINGGLHVISTFIAKNARDEAQAKGRTGRQGNCGSYQIIALDSNYDAKEIFGLSEQEMLQAKKQSRDEQEHLHINNSISNTIPKFLAQDDLYNKFTQFYLGLIEDAKDSKIANPKISQLVEDFGLWLKTRKETYHIIVFTDRAKFKYNQDIFTNPIYPVARHYGVNSRFALVDLMSKATSIDDIYNFAGHYYTAKGWLTVGDSSSLIETLDRNSKLQKQGKDYKTNAVESLMETGNRVAEIVSYLTAMSVSISDPTDLDNQLFKQVSAKISFFKSFIEHIQAAINVITSSAADQNVGIKIVHTVAEVAPDLTKADIEEIQFLGIDIIFEVEAYEPEEESWIDTIFVGCCAIAQMAVGGLIAVGTMGGGLGLATSIFVEGLMDAYRVANSVIKGKPIDLDNYLSGKAINYALIGAQVGFDKLAAASTAKKGLETASKTSLVNKAVESKIEGMAIEQLKTKAVLELAKGAAMQLATNIAIGKITEWVSDEVRENALDGLEDKISGSVSNIIKTALERNPILLMPDCNIERQEILRAIQLSIFNATKTKHNARIINEITSGLLKAASTHSGIAAGLYAMHKIGGYIDIAAKIPPITNELKSEVDIIIDRAAAKAKVRLNNNALVVPRNDELRDSFSNNIGSMVASAILNLIQRKITNPIISSAVTNVTELGLKQYKEEQRGVLEAYSNACIKAGQYNITEIKPKLADKKQSRLSASELEMAKQMESGITGSNNKGVFIGELSEIVKQPIYLFRNGRLEQIFGQGQGGVPINIVYDSENNNYYGLGGKNQSGYSNIYEAIASHAMGNYSSSEILNRHYETSVFSQDRRPEGSEATEAIPGSKETSLHLLSLLDKKPDHEVKLSGITLEYLSSIFQSSQKRTSEPQTSEKQSGERSIEEIASLFDSTGVALPRWIEPGMKPKTIKDVKANLHQDFGKYHNNLPLAMLSVGGELLEYAGQHATYLLGNIEGGIETVKAASYPFVFATDKVKEISQELARNLLTKERYNYVADWYNSLPSGTKIVASSIGEGIILYGGGSALSLATKPLNIKFKTSVSKVEELKPSVSLSKLEHPLIAYEEVTELVKIKNDFSSHFTARDKIIENPYLTKNYLREVENITNLSLSEQQVSLLKEAIQIQEFKKLGALEKEVHRSQFDNKKSKLIKEWEQNTKQKWPVYKVDITNFNKTKILRNKGDVYDAHHIIQIDHGGPNTWWNIHPAHGITEHKLIHGKGSVANQIFKSKKK